MTMPIPTLTSAADSFLQRISDPLRRGRRVAFFDSPPGLDNNGWHRGAYNTTIPQGVKSGERTGLDNNAKKQIFTFLSRIKPPCMLKQETFNDWLEQMIQDVSNICSKESPSTLWTFGRSQKLINMYIKYLVAAYYCSAPDLASFQSQHAWIGEITEFAHAPVDRSTMKVIAKLSQERWFGTTLNPISWWQKSFTKELYDEAQKLLQESADQKCISRIHYEFVCIW